MSAELVVYAFLDRKDETGGFPVFDVAGAVVAHINPSFWGRKFHVSGSDGSLLCTGTPRSMSRTYEVVDAAGRALFEMRSGFWSGKKRTITLAGGAELFLQGASWPSRDWSVLDGSGRTALSIAATASGWSFHPDAYAVQVGDPNLTLAHVAGIVEANRLLVKAARSNG